MAEGTPPAETDNIKKKALTRLTLAGLITLAALAGLWWLDSSGKREATPKPTSPTPIISAPAPIIAPGPAEEPALLAAEDAAPGIETPSEQAPAEPPPPPPRIGSFAKPAPAASVARPTPPPEQSTPPDKAATRPILANAAPPASRGFVVQLGVFTDPGNAQELVTRLKKQGIRAYTETRVHIGPFLNREEAEKAQSELRRLGISGVVGATK